MNWKIKATLQKVLALTNIGDGLNHIPATLNKNYHYNVALFQTHECIRRISYCKFDFSNGKTALEIGTGYSLISSVVMSLLGFEKIITVDITKDLHFSTVKKQLRYLEESINLDKIMEHTIFSEKEVREKIKAVNQANSLNAVFDLLNIKYIAPYTFKNIQNETAEFDYITSLVVLEHIDPETLDSLFEHTKNSLKKDGFCIHTINFIDHFANPGIFQDKAISEFNFLKYSDKYWRFWTENQIAYTNRLSYPFYLELCEKHELNVVDFIGENYRKRKEFDLTQIHADILKKYKSNPATDELVKYQRGTLLIKA
jgi:2-polyprenyl-3-methyl-5-hydroxy-6-metoxy-1,4-benzoquinol methylase